MTLIVISTVAAAVILVRGMFFSIPRMDRCTPHGIRLAWLAMTTGALGVLVRPLYGARPPSMWETALLVGIALYVLFDRRRRDECWRPS